MFNSYGFDHVIIEKPEERAEKQRRLKKHFSRLFLALFVYVVASQFISIAVYLIAPLIVGEEKYELFLNNTTASLIISSVVQYVIAFPIFLAIACPAMKAEKKERKKLSPKDFFLVLCIAQLGMYVGNMIGTTLNAFIGSLTGRLPGNIVDTVVSEVPIWLILVFAVVIAPIVEEIMFRKVLIDRLSVFGEHIAIVFSSVAFGLMHQNLYQFFYAALIGIVLGYIYTVTRDVKYTIALHMIINFMGSIVAVPVNDALVTFESILNSAQLGEPIMLAELLLSGSIVLIYSTVQSGLVVGGAIALTNGIQRRKIRISKDKEIYLPDHEIYKLGAGNTGAILFIAMTLIFTFLNFL